MKIVLPFLVAVSLFATIYLVGTSEAREAESLERLASQGLVAEEGWLPVESFEPAPWSAFGNDTLQVVKTSDGRKVLMPGSRVVSLSVDLRGAPSGQYQMRVFRQKIGDQTVLTSSELRPAPKS
jgi:hypothetical protein